MDNIKSIAVLALVVLMCSATRATSLSVADRVSATCYYISDTTPTAHAQWKHCEWIADCGCNRFATKLHTIED